MARQTMGAPITTQTELRAIQQRERRGRTSAMLGAIGTLALAAGAIYWLSARTQEPSRPPERGASRDLSAARLPGKAQAPAAVPSVPAKPKPAPAHRDSQALADFYRQSARQEPVVAPATGEQLARAIVQQKKGAVQLCYEKQLKRDPRLQGRVEVELSLAPPRKLSSVKVKDSMHNKALSDCVKLAMKRLDLPMLRESMVVEVPFLLKRPSL